MLSIAAVLVLGIWLVDYSGDVSRATGSVRAASTEAAQFAADALASPPAGVGDAQLSAHADEIAERVVAAAAIGDCDTVDQRFDVEAEVLRAPRTPGNRSAEAAVSVEVRCPLRVSSLFNDMVTARVAVPVPIVPGAEP